MRRFAVLLTVVLVTCTTSTPAPSPSPVPPGIGGISAAPAVTWLFSGSLLLPPDPNAYSNVLLDAKPLAAGGWIVLRAVDQRRGLCDPTTYGCFVKRAYGRLLKLGASGDIVAEEHGAEPFGLDHVSIFEKDAVVIGEGQQVRNGTVHAFRLDTLDGIASQLTNCLAIDGRCYSYRIDFQSGRTPLEERDPRDLSLLRALPVTMDALSNPPSIFPASNFVAWRARTEVAPFIHVAALDASRPMGVPWLARLQTACDVTRIGDDRALVLFGPVACNGDTGWHGEIVEVSTGRAVRVFGPNDSISGNVRDQVVLVTSGVAVDPRDGTDGPVLAGDPLSIDWDRGVAVATLADGGAAVFKRQAASPAPRDLSFTSIASATCAELEFPRVMRALAGSVACPGLSTATGTAHILVATGRAPYSPTSFTVTRVVADSATHVIDVRYTGSGRRTRISDPSPAAVIELNAPPSGEWLVRLVGEGADLYTARAFVVRFP